MVFLDLCLLSPLEQFSNVPLFHRGISNSVIFLFISLVLLFFLTKVSFVKYNFLPYMVQLIFEQLYLFVINIVVESATLRGVLYFPFIFSLFFFILLANAIGLIPYSFTTTAQLVISFGLGFACFFGLNYIAFIIHGSHFFYFFLPPQGTPRILVLFLILIEFVSYIFRVFSLSIRLFANMMAGHILLKILSSFAWTMHLSPCLAFKYIKFVPVLIIFGVLFLEFGIVFLQAYIFTVLVSLYLNDVLFLH